GRFKPMDMKIENGDFAVDIYGQSVEINGREALVQGMRLALDLPLGTILARPSMGSRLRTMQGADENTLWKEVLRVTEKFDTDIKAVSADDTTVHIKLETGGQEETIDITFESEAE
ncbi:MAG: hypothetical protein ACI4M3_00790, partial [Acutalibacteraceae bacterium]